MAKSAVKKPIERSVDSLKKLLDQINKGAPDRSKVSDGWIGDKAHQARHSDHNPEPDGTVDARDFTHDPKHGADMKKVAAAIVKSKDPRLSYLIFEGKILHGRKGAKNKKPWVWYPYTGKNGHYHHMHISVLDEGQDDKTAWAIDDAFKNVKADPATKLTEKQVSSILHKGSKGDFVKELQRNLNELGYGPPLEEDGDFGSETEKAVKEFQRQQRMEKIDGWAGPKTLEAIGKALEKKKTAPKIAAAKSVVDEAANGDKSYSSTEVVAGVTGVSGAIATGKAVMDQVNETASSAVDLITAVGPWVLLGIVVVAGAGYIYYSRRQQRIKATEVREDLQ